MKAAQGTVVTQFSFFSQSQRREIGFAYIGAKEEVTLRPDGFIEIQFNVHIEQ